jgi:hypothetical protein
VAQALLEGRGTADLEGLLERTSAAAARARPQGVTPVPRGFAEVAQALAAHRPALERGGVFPPAMLDQLDERLRG